MTINIKKVIDIIDNDKYGMLEVIFCCMISYNIGTNENMPIIVANIIKV